MVITISKLILWMTWHNNLKILMQTYFRLGQWSFAEPQVWQSDWKAEQQVMMKYMMIMKCLLCDDDDDDGDAGCRIQDDHIMSTA